MSRGAGWKERTSHLSPSHAGLQEQVLLSLQCPLSEQSMLGAVVLDKQVVLEVVLEVKVELVTTLIRRRNSRRATRGCSCGTRVIFSGIATLRVRS